ncbi:MAG: carboxypeptidase-like regulatory domain-containing protein, partial [Bacteroidales bacterium]
MIKKYILFILLIVAFGTIDAQTTSGVVKVRRTGGGLEPLAYASVYWLEGKVSAETNDKGEFSLQTKGSGEVSIIATFVGHTKDTVKTSAGSKNIELILREDSELEAARLVERQEGNYLSKMTPVKTEVITTAGLCKMACCNLAESFENSASVTVGYSDAITGARQIRLLGLSGTYTQMLDENRPAMRGVAAPFGLSYVPGQWLESIQIAKGPSSVVNGLEAITGQINLEHRKPTAEQPLFLNLFLGSTLRT